VSKLKKNLFHNGMLQYFELQSCNKNIFPHFVFNIENFAVCLPLQTPSGLCSEAIVLKAELDSVCVWCIKLPEAPSVDICVSIFPLNWLLAQVQSAVGHIGVSF